MDDVTIARVVHVLSVVLWIGGVGFVTTVLIPVARRLPDPASQAAVFEAMEGRFGAQARITVLLAGLSGLYMLIRMNAWYRFAAPAFWWMHAMVLVWLIFAGLLFVLEPLVLHRRFAEHARRDPEAAFRLLHRAHVILLVLSLLTIAGAVAGSHGMVLFD
jgi:uncharacterized membrane protein